MKQPIFIFSSGLLERKDNTIRFSGGKGRRYIPVETTSEIHIFGEVEFNSRLLNFLTQAQIPLHIYNYHGYYAGSYMPREHYVSGFLTLQQASHYNDHQRRMELARSFVEGAMLNICKVLNYYRRRGADIAPTIEMVEEYHEKIRVAKDVETLMAWEGLARAEYYKSWDTILRNDDFRFESRTKRPPQNRINALISFGNSLLYVTCLSEIYRTHLDPRISFLHATNYRRYSLNLDIAEIFKPIVVDRVIFSLINKGMLKANAFRKDTQGVFLSEAGRSTFLEAYNSRLKDTFRVPRLKRHVSYRRLIRMELYKIEKHLIGDEKYRPYVARW